MGIRIRRATAADLDAVRLVGIVTWPPTYGPVKGTSYVIQGLDAYWSADAVRTAIAEDRVEVAEGSDGVIGMSEVEDLGADLALWKLYVLPAAQGAGAGHALVAAAQERAAARGRDLLTEYVPENTAVAGFYAHEGFVATEPPFAGSDAVWLRWRRP